MQEIKWIFFLFLISLSSCTEHLIPSEYVAWVDNEENGFHKKKSIHPLEVDALYKPVPYVISNEERTNDIAQESYDARAKELEGLQYFTLKLGIAGGGQDVTNYGVETDAQQQERLAYLSFAMQKDIKLIEGRDTLACALYHFERSYDIAPYRTFVLAFEKGAKQEEENDKTLVLDLAYFQTGPIKLNFKASDLGRVPSLKL